MPRRSMQATSRATSPRSRSTALLALLALAFGALSASTGALAVDGGSANQLLSAATELAVSVDGPAGTLAFAALHTLAIVLCFPGTILFELAAGALYGLGTGVVVVSLAKGSAAAVTWFLVQALREGPFGQWVQERASAGFQFLGGAVGARAQQFRSAAAQGGFRFCLLARLSPLPSWANNYGLPLLGSIDFATYFPATLLGMLLPLASNVYSGTVASSLAAALSGGTGPQISAPGLALSLLSAVSGAALIQQLSSYAGSEVSDPGADGSGGRSQQ